MTKFLTSMAAAGGLSLMAGAALAQPVQIAGAPCKVPAEVRCAESGCTAEQTANPGSVVDPATGRRFFLDYPCDLKKGEKVTFVLNLHGGGSYGNWQRHYFPIVDQKDKYRLVIATPNAPPRVWRDTDDAHLQNIVSFVEGQLGPQNIRAFWLAGHSQGGATSRRIVCSDFFRTRVDGFISLSGGRVGGSARTRRRRRAAGTAHRSRSGNPGGSGRSRHGRRRASAAVLRLQPHLHHRRA